MLVGLVVGLTALARLAPAAPTSSPTAQSRPATQPAAAEAPRGPQALAAHGSDDWFWVAQARPERREPGFFGGGDGDAGTGAPGIHTSIHARPASGGPWIELPPAGERVVSLGSRGSQLAVLLESGQWELLSPPDIAATGQALPVAGARLLAFSNTRSDLWALASVPGGAAAINAAGAAQSPSSQPVATHPATLPTTPAAATTTTRSATAASTRAATSLAASASPTTIAPAGPQLKPVPPVPSTVLSIVRLTPGGWTGEADLPAEVATPSDVVSFALIGGQADAYVAMGRPASPGMVQLYRRADGGRWEAFGGPVAVQNRPFRLLTGTMLPVLWLGGAAPAQADVLVMFDRDGVGRPVSLDATRDTPPPQRAAAYATGKIRAVYVDERRDRRLFEQVYDPGSGAPVGEPSALAWQGDAGALRWSPFTTAVITGAMLLSIMASLRRRAAMRAVDLEAVAPLLAPLGLRLLAGIIDALPLIALWVYEGMTGFADQTALNGPPFWIAVGVYVAHTMLAEGLTGRSIGKMACGLKVVSLDGSRPTFAQVALRNFLRVIDAGLMFLPLLLIPFSPLRQRVGDAAAGTLVVLKDAAETAGEDEASGKDDVEGKGT
jgi:uncharacterized RDD family membrane protein YckC